MLLQGQARVLRRKSCFAGRMNLVYKTAVSNDTAAFLFCPRPTGAVHAAVQNMSLSVLLHPPKRVKKHRFPRLQTGAGCPPRTIDISVYKPASGPFYAVVPPQCMQRFHVPKRNVYKIIAKFDVPPMMHPSFLCKMAKYTCCTVFRAKFIHFSEGVNSCVKTRAIFVRFLFGYLQFASFFLLTVLLS